MELKLTKGKVVLSYDLEWFCNNVTPRIEKGTKFKLSEYDFEVVDIVIRKSTITLIVK